MKPLRILAIGLVVSLAILGVRWVLFRDGKGESPPPVRSSRIRVSPAPDESPRIGGPAPLRPGQKLPEAVLIDQDDREIRISDFRGNLLVLAFIYTHCDRPSMCPLTTAKLVDASDRLGRMNLEQVQFLLVSFDPERDDTGRLREYAGRFEIDPARFHFATGETGEIRKLSQQLNTYYRPGARDGFDHNITVSLIDRDGTLQKAFLGPEWPVEELVSSISELADGSGRSLRQPDST